MKNEAIKKIRDCNIGKGTKIWNFVNLYECEIGKDCMIGSFVEIQKGVKIGDRVRIQSHSFLCTGVEVESDVFIGHGAMFVNDRYPPSGDSSEWEETLVKRKAVIGNGATILPVTIGENSLIGAGSVVTEDVPPNTIVAGNPAEVIGERENAETIE